MFSCLHHCIFQYSFFTSLLCKKTSVYTKQGSDPRYFKILYYTGSAILCRNPPQNREIVPKIPGDQHIYGFSFCPSILFKAAQPAVPEFLNQFQLGQFRIVAEFRAAWRLPDLTLLLVKLSHVDSGWFMFRQNLIAPN